MSYILDALKKKESSNEQSVPDISSQHYHTEFAEDNTGLSPIVWIVFVVLVVAIIAYLAYQFGQSANSEPVTPIAINDDTLEKVSPVKVSKTLSKANGQSSTNELKVESVPIEVGTAVVEKVKRSSKIQTRQVTDSSRVVQGTDAQLPATAQNPAVSTPELIDNNLSALPKIRYSSHVYADSPQDRFVMLNGRTYGIGESLANGVKIEDILEDNLLVNYRGKTYKIPSLTDIN